MTDFQIFAERERAGWSDDAIVAAYVDRFGPVTDEIARELSARVAGPGRAVLDLCCGQGALTAMLAEAGAETHGLDFSETMLSRAERRAPGAILHHGDATAMPFEAGRFDAVVCNFGMMHLPDQPAALAEIRRVLKPAGRFVMATWAAPDVSPAFGTVFGTMRAHADMSKAPPQPDLFAFAKPDVARGMMTAAGLEMTAHETRMAAWEFDRPEGLFETFLTATVGAAMLIRSQTPETVERIAAAITGRVARDFADGAGFRVPVAVSVVTARPV